MSPRNTAAAIIKLMKDTSCHRLLTTQHTLRPLIDDIRSQLFSADPNYALQIDEVPLLSTIFPRLGNETYEDDFTAYPTGPRPPLDDVMLYLHSSGSTGLPKTVPQTFKAMVDWASFRASSLKLFIAGINLTSNCTATVTDRISYHVPLRVAGHGLPSFHTLGIITQVHGPLFSLVPVGLFPPTATAPHLLPVIPTPHNVLDHMVRSRCNGLMTIPSFLQTWAQDQNTVTALASLEFVVSL